MTNFVAPTGYVELDNDCNYSIDTKSTRSREELNPKEDLAFYFNTYIIPKYGLNNLNVSNVASFMKDLEMNWTKLDSDLKNKVLDILVDGILSNDTSFKADLLKKLGPTVPSVPTVPMVPSSFTSIPGGGKPGSIPGKSTFGSTNDNNNIYIGVIITLLVLGFVFIMFDRMKKNKMGGYPKFK